MALRPYQYQLGSIPFGRDTDITISKVDIQPYNVSTQDTNVPRSDETRFGLDQLIPGNIVFTMSVVENYPLISMEDLTGQWVPDDVLDLVGTKLPILAKTWKARQLRMSWGSSMPLLCCDRNGVVRRIYGRPGKFTHAPRYSDNTLWIDVMAEFRRQDTFAYNDIEYFIADPIDDEHGLAPGADPITAERDDGDADAWFRVLIEGPAEHPLITYGGNTIELDSSIPAGVIVEVSSYPWSRRVLDSVGVNRRTELVGSTMYLDQLTFPAGTSMDISWTCDGATADTGLFFLWREAYNVI